MGAHSMDRFRREIELGGKRRLLTIGAEMLGRRGSTNQKAGKSIAIGHTTILVGSLPTCLMPCENVEKFALAVQPAADQSDAERASIFASTRHLCQQRSSSSALARMRARIGLTALATCNLCDVMPPRK